MSIKNGIGLVFAIMSATVHAQQWERPSVVSSEGDVAVMFDTVALDSKTVVVAYYEHRSKGGKAVLCRVNGDKAVPVSSAPFDSDGKISGASSVAMARLSDERFILCYQDTSPVGKALVGRVRDDRIQWMSETVFSHPNKAEFYDVAALSGDKVVFAFHGASTKRGFVVAAELLEDTPILGAAVEINPAGSGEYLNQFNRLLALDENRFVLAWSELKSGGHGFARVGTLNGLQISLGPTAQYSAANAPYPAMSALGKDAFALAFRDGDASGKPSVITGTVRGKTIEFGSPVTVPADGVADCVAAAPLNGNIFGVTYRNNAMDRESVVHLCEVSGDTVEVTPKFPLSKGASFQQLAKLDDRSLLFAHIVPGNKVECALFRMKAETDSIKKARMQFASSLKQLEKAYAESVIAYRDTYLKSLDKLASQFTRTGELAPVMALRAEKKRFLAENAAASPPQDAPKDLARLQTRFIEVLRQARKKHAHRLHALVSKYLEQLNMMQSDFVRKEQIDDALAVKQEAAKARLVQSEFEAKAAKTDIPELPMAIP